jgi:hypothetical protein
VVCNKTRAQGWGNAGNGGSQANYPLLNTNYRSLGAVAQLGERLLCKQEVTGSIPVSSTRSQGIWFRKTGRKQGRCPMLGVKHDTVIIYFTVTRNVVLTPIIGQVRRATITQLHLTLSESCKVKPARAKPEASDRPIAAQVAQA